ncbi:MAG: hypothetical protein KJ063_07845, partial [Anaerolineae bacterium]|nr:hypothetical protein [Anaerolineae bacterium]
GYVQAGYVQAGYVQAGYVQAGYVRAGYVRASCQVWVLTTPAAAYPKPAILNLNPVVGVGQAGNHLGQAV